MRAAQYLRMSTEHQKYSLENQALAIAEYAEKRNLKIVRTYQDQGRSGLTFEGRPGLQQLIKDALNNACDFTNLLIYDVSRWGRFQDLDESAYYEFICKAAGVTVHYSAECFENDNSIGGILIKNIKRVMAAEYSRVLSQKVYAGQCNLIRLGFRQGGRAGIGLRRQLIDKDGKPKGFLRVGERKSIATDRVLLVPGSHREVSIVRCIFRLYVDRRLSRRAIADFLNKKRRGGEFNWTSQSVKQVLTNEKYIGNNVFNRGSRKLRGPLVKNPASEWIRVERCFAPIVSKKMFVEAQKIRKVRQERLSNDTLIDRLRDLLDEQGQLSISIIDKAGIGLKSACIAARFGGLLALYRSLGFRPKSPGAKGYNEAELLDHLRALLARHGRLTVAIINAGKPGPDPSTYIQHFGSLPAAYQRAGYVRKKKPTRHGLHRRVANQKVSKAIKNAPLNWHS